MKWLLITTATRTPDTLDSNVGDEFARIGIQNVIREVDPKAEFDILDKENADAWNPRPFDKAVVCGMPLFWSLPSMTYPGSQNCQEVWWWPRLMRGWPSAVRENFLVWGVGHVFVDRIRSLHDYVSGIEEVLNRSWKLIVREPVIDHPKIVDSICPSAFCLHRGGLAKEVKLCNLMKAGGHFGYLTEDSDSWGSSLQAIANVLKDQGFIFIAHNVSERDLATELGWPKDKVKLPQTAEGYMHWYCRCTQYFGNRLHGAAVCASAGIPTFAASHDSRLGMVTRLGGYATRTQRVTAAVVKAWCDKPYKPVPTPFTVEGEWDKMIAMVKQFMDEKPKAPWTE